MLFESRESVKTKTYPAPVGGLNARDPLAEMDPADAIIIENLWVKPSKVIVRKGYISWATGFAAEVQSLVEYLPVSGVAKLFAASNGSIYDVTTAGAIGAAVVSGVANNKWQDTSLTTAAGNFLHLFNGVDSPRLYDGATWETVTGVSARAITGVTTTKLVQGCVFKNRLWMVEVDSTRAWYLPTSAIAGAATSFDLGAIFRLGGYLVAIYSWTLDAGAGADDILIFISSNGEVAVYKGTDPAVAASFSLIGVFSLGRPIGRRCGIKFGGDVLIICEEGIYPLSRGLLSSSIDKRVAKTDKIQNSISEDVVNYRLNFGWEMQLFPEQSMLLLNVPAGNGANFQYALNTITQAWTKFTGWDARCWRSAVTGLYFGDSNSVKKAWQNNLDGTVPITFNVLSSYQNFDMETQNKFFVMLRPYLRSTGNPSILFSLNGNFVDSEPTGALTFTPTTGMVWGSMSWGSMVWGGLLTSFTSWNTVGGVYNVAAIRLKGQSNGAVLEWAATDYAFIPGGLL